ncbi:hypothetical protein ACYULU_07965 [Breznakiellaceae bacterium SP9]
MTAEQQQQQLDNAAKELFEYVDNVWIIKDMSDHIHKKFGIASPYLNFRDALFHYNKMYKAAVGGDEFTFIQQSACVEEHLNRGLKDFAIHLCTNFYIKILHEMLRTKAASVNASNIPNIRNTYHDIKNIVVEIRIEGQTLQHFDNHRIIWFPKMVATIKVFNELLEKDRSLKQLYVRFTNKMFEHIRKRKYGKSKRESMCRRSE